LKRKIKKEDTSDRAKTYQGNQAHLSEGFHQFQDEGPPLRRRPPGPDFSGRQRGAFSVSPRASAPAVLMTIPFFRSKGTFRFNDTIFIAWKPKRADRDFGQSELVVRVRLGSNPRGRTSPLSSSWNVHGSSQPVDPYTSRTEEPVTVN